MKQILSTILLMCLGLVSYAQPDVLITDANYVPGELEQCACSTDFNDGSIKNFHDSGGLSADYGANENDTITFCPDVTGTKMYIAFGINTGYTLDVDVSDTIFIFDGPSTSYPPLDTLNSVITPNGIPSTPASWSNISGCLTVQFISDGAVEGTGWDANVACGILPQPFYPHMEGLVNGESIGANDTIDDINPSDTGYVDVCFGDSILFVATPYFPYEPGGDTGSVTGAGYDQSGNYTLEWTFSDGTSATGNNIWFKPPARIGYFVTVKVMDSLGIFQYLFCKIRVSTIPSFETCDVLDPEICLGDYTILLGGVTTTDTVGVDAVPSSFPVGGIFGAQTYLPDGSGQNYETTINMAGFTPGSTISDSLDIDRVCVSIEHSYLGDLEMELTCPNAVASVNIFNSYVDIFGINVELFPGGFDGGTVFLGGALDNNIGNIGVCEEYCFSNMTGSQPSWASTWPLTPQVAASGPSLGTMVTPGTYQPEENFGALAGCDINGTWTITIRDNLGQDDGYICEWSIYFKDSLVPDEEFYVTEIVDEFWHPDPTITLDLNNDTTIVVVPDSVGMFYYTFEVEDSYGCSYDTTIGVEVVGGSEIMPYTYGCMEDAASGHDGWVDFVGTYAPLGGSWWAVGPGTIQYSPNATSTNPSVYASENGQYTFYFEGNQCQDTVSTVVEFFNKPTVNISYNGDSTVSVVTMCRDDDATLFVGSTMATDYFWNVPGGNKDSIVIIANSLYVEGGNNEFLYQMDVTGYCGFASDEVLVVIEDCEIPNVITPNGDGQNDFFLTNFANYYDDVSLTIYNRWGKIVYTTDSYNNNWKGVNKKGKNLASGTYYYIMNWNGGTKEESGFVTIFDGR